jgi:hypothetical protein
MARRKKTGNYSRNDRELILEAATSHTAGMTIGEKQDWLLKRGVHRPGCPTEPVSESAIKYWQSAHRRVKNNAENAYDEMINRLLTSPPSYRALKELLNSDSE